MKCIISLAAAALAVAATPALADGIVGGAVGGSFSSEQRGGFELNAKVEGSSGSGFQQELSFGKNSIAAFGSIGTASSATSVSPFSVDTSSSHAGGFAGVTAGNATMDGMAMNFAQSEGKASFKADGFTFDQANTGFVAFGGFTF